MTFFRRDKDDAGSAYRPTPGSRLTPREENEMAQGTESSIPGGAGTPTVQREGASTDRYRKDATTVAKDTAFSGTLKSDGNLFIEGEFEGELEANQTIFIADTAQVRATVRATDVIVAGTLDGTVEASDRFHAMATAKVSGEINSAVLVVDESSHVNCRFSMKRKEG